jgi:hypothetical protein
MSQCVTSIFIYIFPLNLYTTMEWGTVCELYPRPGDLFSPPLSSLILPSPRIPHTTRLPSSPLLRKQLLLPRDHRPVLDSRTVAPRNVAIGREIPISEQHASVPDSTDPMTKPDTEKGELAHWSNHGRTSAEPCVFLQSRIKSHTVLNMLTSCTPAACMRMFAVSAMRCVVVPLASTLAQTE